MRDWGWGQNSMKIYSLQHLSLMGSAMPSRDRQNVNLYICTIKPTFKDEVPLKNM